MGTVWFPDGERQPLPTSGQIVGWLAEQLRVKGALKDVPGADERTARRYFAGERIEPDKREAILGHLVEALQPQLLVDEALALGIPDAWLAGYLRLLLDQWDAMAGSLRTASFPITSTKDACLPFLRLVVLDAGLRVAALLALRREAGRPGDEGLAGLAHDALKHAMDACIGRCGQKPRLDDIRKEAKVSKNSLDAWRAGTQVPHDENLRQLAACFAARGAGDEARVLAELRFGAAITAGWNALADVVSRREWVENYVKALKLVVKHAAPWFTYLPLPRDKADALREVVVFGAHSEAGAAASLHLASLAPMSQEVQADFVALPGDWGSRINEHLRALGTIPIAARHVVEKAGGVRRMSAGQLTDLMFIQHFGMAGWDARPEDYPHMVTVSGPPEVKAMNRLQQADRWWSAGQRDEALAHLRRALELDPKHASLHYRLGSYLGIRLHEEGRSDLLDEALLELRLAVDLGRDDPHMKKIALTEIGIVQGNAGLFEDAIATYAEAEPYAQDWAHYWSVRGSTLMWLDRLDEAASAFRRALELQADNAQALERLGAVLAALGHARQARDLARKVELLTGRNPEPAFDRILRQSAPRRRS